MLNEAPPGRYRVIERDRRLVTVDTLSGLETGAAASSEAASLESRSLRLGAGPQQTGSSRATATTASAASAGTSPSPQSNPGPWGQAATRLSTTERQTRIIGLVFVGIAIAAVLILTGLWIPVGVVLLVPQIRTPVWTAAKPALMRYLNGS